MEGNTLMDEIKEGVLTALRNGWTIESVKDELLNIINELKAMDVYVQAIKDADFRP